MTDRVADYPRPPALVRDARRVRVVLGGGTLVDAHGFWKVLETYHPPTVYIPRAAFPEGSLIASDRRSFCEWKGVAHYLTLVAHGGTAPDAAWTYPEPTPGFAPIRDHVALYAGRVDACYIDDVRVVPQPGGFYAGWITPELVGPFKGAPGTEFW